MNIFTHINLVADSWEPRWFLISNVEYKNQYATQFGIMQCTGNDEAIYSWFRATYWN